ncbi:MAG: CHAT domain-containing protein [Ktedonobacteraceae bacterium]
MDNDQFLQQLRELNLDEGRAFIHAHASELADPAAFGVLLADDALEQMFANPSVSLKLSELLISFGERLHHASSHALGLKAKGDVLRVIGLHQAAIDCLDAAGQKFLELGDEGNWARSRISWILAAAWLGRVEEALQEAARARRVFIQLEEYYWVCVINHNVALIYYYLGQYLDAIEIYEGMLSIYPTLTDQNETSIRRSIAVAEVNQALNLALLGRFEEAYLLHQKVLATFIALNETSMIINSEINLADLDYVQGYYGSALSRYYQAQDRLVQAHIDNPLMLGELKLCMGNCLVKINKVQEACLLVNEAIEIYRQFATPLSTGIALHEYTIILMFSDRLEEALTTLDEAWMLFNREGFDHYASATKLQQAELNLQIGAFDKAYNDAHLVHKYFEAQGLVERSIRASLVMAGSLVEHAKLQDEYQAKERRTTLLQEAMALCKKIVIQAHQHNLQEVVYRNHYLLGQLYVLLENPKKAARHYSAAIAQIERILDNLAYDLSPSFLHTLWTIYENMIALCLQQSQAEQAFIYLERARSMALYQYLNKSKILQVVPQADAAIILRTQQDLKDWQERYHDYSVLIANTDPSMYTTLDREVIQSELKHCETKISELFERLHLYQSSVSPTPHARKRPKYHTKHIDLARLRQQLAPDQLLLAYFLYQGKLVIFAITTEGVTPYEIYDGMEQIERLLPLLHAHLQPGGWPDVHHPPQQAIRRLLNKLYNLLIAPVANILPRQLGTLTIVPYGPLHNLPFHALHDGSQYLIENFQINYLPASNLFMHLNSYQHEQKIPDSAHTPLTLKQPLILGYSSNGYLQRSIDEAQVLADLLHGHCYLDSDATITQLTQLAPHSPIIHIATHGHSRLDAPNFSYVLLADGQLNAIDAFSLELKDCELVTLSGCETGLALSGGGDEQLGLGRAFLAAGARSLVMSLWSVEDNATTELMQIFYQHLLHGKSKVEALRAAQCQLLQSSSSNYSHPYFWAAFRLVGDASPLSENLRNTVFARSMLSC